MGSLRCVIASVLVLAIATTTTAGAAAQDAPSREPAAVLGWALDETHVQGPALGESDTITLTGEGAYEGLSAVVIMDWGLGGGRFRGAIFPGEMPPLP